MFHFISLHEPPQSLALHSNHFNTIQTAWLRSVDSCSRAWIFGASAGKAWMPGMVDGCLGEKLLETPSFTWTVADRVAAGPALLCWLERWCGPPPPPGAGALFPCTVQAPFQPGGSVPRTSPPRKQSSNMCCLYDRARRRAGVASAVVCWLMQS